MVGGALAIAILNLLVKKKVLTIRDVDDALKTAQGSLISSPAVTGAVDGARILGEIREHFRRPRVPSPLAEEGAAGSDG